MRVESHSTRAIGDAQAPASQPPARRRGMRAALLRRAFGIRAVEATFARRGFFEGRAAARQRLERIGEVFIAGYTEALEASQLRELGEALARVESDLRGFAYEGASMGLTLLALLMPWRRRLVRDFMSGTAAGHTYLAHVGVGWALAALPIPPALVLGRLDPLLRWLAIDGYGFRQGYFAPGRAVRRRAVPRRLRGYARRAFDQGLGRSLWFVECADVERIARTVSGFPPSRRDDLWSGVGLACAYAGGAERDDLCALRDAAGAHRRPAAQGASFAAKARERAGNPAPHTDGACRVLCGMSAEEAAAVTDRALVDLPERDSPEVPYEVWRRRVQACFAGEASMG